MPRKKKVVSGRSEPTPSREEVRALTARIHSLYRSSTLFLAISGLVDRIVVRARRAGIVVIVCLSPLRSQTGKRAVLDEVCGDVRDSRAARDGGERAWEE